MAFTLLDSAPTRWMVIKRVIFLPPILEVPGRDVSIVRLISNTANTSVGRASRGRPIWKGLHWPICEPLWGTSGHPDRQLIVVCLLWISCLPCHMRVLVRVTQPLGIVRPPSSRFHYKKMWGQSISTPGLRVYEPLGPKQEMLASEQRLRRFLKPLDSPWPYIE